MKSIVKNKQKTVHTTSSDTDSTQTLERSSSRSSRWFPKQWSPVRPTGLSMVREAPVGFADSSALSHGAQTSIPPPISARVPADGVWPSIID